jgi:hypothetical protein
MSPPNPTPDDLNDATIAAGMGVGSFLIRALCADKKESLRALAVQTLLAGLVAVLVGLASKGWFTEVNSTFHLAVAGWAGFASPEIVRRGLLFIRGWRSKS